MSRAWETFQNAGSYGLVLLLCGIVALLVSLIALAVAFGSKRGGVLASGAALGIAGVGMSLGGLGTWRARRMVDEVLAAVAIDWSVLERVCLEGYREARDVAVVALVLHALPLALAALAVAVAVSRARAAGGQGSGPAFAVVGVAAVIAVLGSISSIVGLRSGDAAARARALGIMKSELGSFLPRQDCDVCKSLQDAFLWRGAEQVERDVPGAHARARQCVDERLAEIRGGRRRSLQACSGDSPPPPPAPESTFPPEPGEPMRAGDAGADDAREQALRDAAEFGIVGLLGQRPGSLGRSDRLDELRELRESPLLIDEAQRKRIDALLAAARTPPPDLSLGAGAPRKVAKMRVGATTVSGRLPPEVIQRIVRQNFGRFRLCYEAGLKKDPKLEGRVSVSFVIGRDGAVSSAKNAGSDMTDRDVVECVLRAFSGLSFPAPEGGIVTVSYPLLFSPPE